MKKLIILFIALALLTGCAPINKHLWGYEKAILMRGAEPVSPLYYSIAGVEDKIWFDMPSVQDRAAYLAGLIGYEGRVACSADGKYLYIIGD